MKKIFYTLLAGIVLLTSSCADFTDLQPKGKNLLSTTNDLEMLLNAACGYGSMDLYAVAFDNLYSYSLVPNNWYNPIPSKHVLQWKHDEASVDMYIELATSDDDYTGFYGWVGMVSNPILANVDRAEGADDAKKKLKAEALAGRAWSMWLAAQKFAKAYDPANTSEPCMPYILEDFDIAEKPQKLSQGDFYAQLLKDLDEAIALNALPALAINNMRFSQPALYAIKAHVLASMQDLKGAAEAADKAISFGRELENWNDFVVDGSFTHPQKVGYDEDLFMPVPDYMYYNIVTPEAYDYFEDGNIIKEHFDQLGKIYLKYYGFELPSEMTVGVYDVKVFYDFGSYLNRWGITLAQMYLLKAENEINNGSIDKGMEYLDVVRQNRIVADKYEPLKGMVTTKAAAIEAAKRVWHGEGDWSIWNFLSRKRWNVNGDWKQTWVRSLDMAYQGGHQVETVTIAPESSYWVFPIPRNVTSVNENMTQNIK